VSDIDYKRKILNLNRLEKIRKERLNANNLIGGDISVFCYKYEIVLRECQRNIVFSLRPMRNIDKTLTPKIDLYDF